MAYVFLLAWDHIGSLLEERAEDLFPGVFQVNLTLEEWSIKKGV